MNEISSTVSCEMRGPLAIVALNRPERMNGVVKQMEFELRDLMQELDQNQDVRAIVLTGAGKAFCAGMDMHQVDGLAPDDIRDMAYSRPFNMNARPDFQTRYSYFAGMRTPVVAAINGAAAGLGLVLALYCDIRFASDKAVFATAFAQRGLIAEHGVAWILSKIVGQANALDLLMTSRKIGAEEAKAMGLVNRVVPHDQLLEEAVAYATLLTDTVSPRSTRIIKRLVWEASFQTLGEAIRSANDEMWHALSPANADFEEGVRHFVEKRKPRFTQS